MKKHKQHLIDHNTLESTAQKVDSSTAAMDRQALQSKARDDRENADSSNAQNLNNSQAAKTTPTPRKAESQAILCACSEFVYLGSLPYTLRLPTGKTYPLHQGDSFIVPQGDLSRYLEYKSTMFKKLRWIPRAST